MSLQKTFSTPVAVFPLPDTAVIPGEVVPLHLFEPRYRQMVDDILEHDYLLGVTLAGEVLHKPEVSRNEDPLVRNQQLYTPNVIFGCGPVVLKERFSDGRAVIDLYVEHKVEVSEMLQTLPYYLARVSPLKDEKGDEKLEHNLAQDLTNELVGLANSIDPSAGRAIDVQARDCNLREVIALTLGIIRFPGEFKQLLLEQDLALNRGELLLAKLPELFPRTTH